MKDRASERKELRKNVAQYQIRVGREAAFGLSKWERAANRKLNSLGFAPGTIQNWMSVGRNVSERLLVKKFSCPVL